MRALLRPQLIVVFGCACLLLTAVLLPSSSQVGHRNSKKNNGHAYHGNKAKPDVQRVAAAKTSKVDCSLKPCLALTFDDGPHLVNTPHVLDILAAHNVKATFFLIGNRVAGNEAIVQRMHREGHEVGNHSWDHADFTTLNQAQIDSEIHQAQAAITRAGVPMPKLLRPPYGSVNDVVLSHADMTVVMWNIDPNDWEPSVPNMLVDSVVKQARPGGIILLHDVHETTAAAVEPIINALSGQYQFVTVSQLLQLSSGSQGQYYAH